MFRLLFATMAGAAMLAAAPAAQATIFIYGNNNLNGAIEFPPNISAGTGTAYVTIDDVANTMLVNVTFSGLTGTTLASHIHCCVAPLGTVGVATTLPTFPGFPLGVTSGTYSQTFDLLSAATYNSGFITANGGTVAGARATLLSGLAAGTSYLNIHTTFAPGGEIRGFLQAGVPEPSTWALLILGFGGVGLAMRRRRTLQPA
jgi:hypothetical protein